MKCKNCGFLLDDDGHCGECNKYTISDIIDLAGRKEMIDKRKQVGGTHYQNLAIEPIDYILANELDFCEGNVVKYVSRWKNKGGIQDLRKAAQNIEFLIERAEEENE